MPSPLERKLRRGHWRVQDELDLHGLNRVQAGALLEDFLRECTRRRMNCVRVIHGKGEGILREAVRVLLNGRRDVAAFCEAPPAQGGSGAVLVLLRN